MSRILEASDRARRLTRQLLAFSRKQVLEMRVVNLNTIVREFEDMLRRLIGEDVEMRLDLDPRVGNTLADPAQIEQILMNLAVNARDAMPDGGLLTISTCSGKACDGDCRNCGDPASASHACLCVADTGCGMDEETRRRLFEPFFTSKEGGTGLGLSTVYGIVQQHNGCIIVDSAPGEGARFTICVPCSPAAVAAAETPPAAREGASGRGTILVVEDEEMVRRLVCRILDAAGYSVIECDSPDAAIAAADRHEGRIDLLLTDVIMPRMNGREMYQRLRAARSDLRVIYMSGYTDDVVVQRGALERDVELLEKPFTMEALTTRVGAALK